MEKKTILIGEYEYNITDFKHPGGSVINYMTNGQDATQAFQEFHYRSKTAHLILKSLPHVPRTNYDSTDKDMIADFAEFRKSLETRGFFKPSTMHVCYRVFEIVALYLFASYMIRYNIFVSLFLFGLVGGRCGWIQHEGGHNSLTGNIKTDKLIQNIFLGFITFGDGSTWNSMHNKHHATPQKIGQDIDMDTAPLVAFHDINIDNIYSSAIKRQWLKYQMYTYLPITSGLFIMPLWAFYLHPRKALRDKNIRQLLLIVAGHLTRISLFMNLRPTTLANALFYHFIAIWLTGIYLFGQFSLSHTFTPIVDKNENPNWIRYAIEHTVDINPENRLVGWIMGYLNNQVVHHLFPSMPQYRGPEVSRELIKFCKKWDIKYTIMTYYEAWFHMFANLHKVSEHAFE